MLTIKNHCRKGEPPPREISASNQPVRIEAMHVTQTTPSRGSDVATSSNVYTTNHTGGYTVATTNTSPNAVLNGPNGSEFARISKWGTIDSILQALDLEKDVFKIPIETLLNLWVTRFGNEWVDLEAVIDGDDFFLNAYKRLKQMGLLEQHYLTDRARYVCRKPE